MIFLLRICSCRRRRIHRPVIHSAEHCWRQWPPGVCVPGVGRQDCLLPGDVRRMAGHHVRARAAPLLPRVHHPRNSRLHLRQRRRLLPELQHRGQKNHFVWTTKHIFGTGQDGRPPKYGPRVPELHLRWNRRSKGQQHIIPDLSGPPMEGLLRVRYHGVAADGPHQPHQMVAVEPIHLRIVHLLLRRVCQLWSRLQHRPARAVVAPDRRCQPCQPLPGQQFCAGQSVGLTTTL